MQKRVKLDNNSIKHYTYIGSVNAEWSVTLLLN